MLFSLPPFFWGKLNRCLLINLDISSACPSASYTQKCKSQLFSLLYLYFLSSYSVFYKTSLEIYFLYKLAKVKQGTTQICTFCFIFVDLFRNAKRTVIEGCLDVVNKCPYNLISHAQGNWELTSGCQLSCELSQKSLCNKKKKVQSTEIERSSAFIFDDSWALWVRKGDFKRLKLANLIFWRISYFCFFTITFIIVKLMISSEFRWYDNVSCFFLNVIFSK